MKAKTVLELITMSSGLYYLTKDKELMDRLTELKDKSLSRINNAASSSVVDADGNELEFIDKMIHAASEAKNELEQKVEELVAKLYQKINIAHVDEIRALNERLEKSDKAIALLEARLNKLEAKD
jgi:BMFP domain-containing protein YqiC